MEQELKVMIEKELELFHSSILLNEVKEKVRILKSYGVGNEKLEAVLYDEELFSKLVITKDYQILLGDDKRETVSMEPLVKAVYLLFLNHPEGIVLKQLPDYREELTAIYLKLTPKGLTKRVEKSIEDVTNPMMNSINEKCTRIRRVFTSVLPRSVVRYYVISGKRGESKSILLPRVNVVWECELPRSQAL